MPDVSMRDMLEAGAHFGHQTRNWSPKMLPYIFGERNKIHIINLEKTLPLYKEAMNFLNRMAANRGTILFVGTKRAAQETIREQARRCAMPYVDRRWLGGMLTNFRTVKQSIRRLKELEAMMADGSLQKISKKEALSLTRDLQKLERSLGGIKDMEGLPDVLLVIDVGHEKIAVREAVKLGIPVVGIVDTNNEPDGVDYVIPGNDDAIRAIQLYVVGAADAVLEGRMSAQLKVPSADDSGHQDGEAIPEADAVLEVPSADDSGHQDGEAIPEADAVLEGAAGTPDSDGQSNVAHGALAGPQPAGDEEAGAGAADRQPAAHAVVEKAASPSDSDAQSSTGDGADTQPAGDATGAEEIGAGAADRQPAAHAVVEKAASPSDSDAQSSTGDGADTQPAGDATGAEEIGAGAADAQSEPAKPTVRKKVAKKKIIVKKKAAATRKAPAKRADSNGEEAS